LGYETLGPEARDWETRRTVPRLARVKANLLISAFLPSQGSFKQGTSIISANLGLRFLRGKTEELKPAKRGSLRPTKEGLVKKCPKVLEAVFEPGPFHAQNVKVRV
jgi:hypothetical protein